MAASVIGTPLALALGTGSDPAAQNVTVPSGASHAILFWSYQSYVAGSGLLSATLNSVSPSQSIETACPTTDVGDMATGAAIWITPTSGTRSLDVSFDASSQATTAIMAFIQDGSSIRDIDSGYAQTGTLQLTIDTQIDDLVLAFHTRYAGTPDTLSGYTSIQTETAAGPDSRLQYLIADSTSESASYSAYYSGMVLLSIYQLVVSTALPRRALDGPFYGLLRGSVR